MHAQSHSNSHCHHQHLSSNSIPKVSCDRIEISTIQPDLFILFYLAPRGNHPASRQLSDRGQPPLFYLQLESRILNPRRQKQLDDPRLAMFFLLENKHLFVNRSRQFFDNFEFTISNSTDLNSSRVFRTDFPRKVERMDLIISTKLFRIGN